MRAGVLVSPKAAEALGCRVVYALIPEESLTDTVRKRALMLAERKLASVDQTMRLEDQAVAKSETHKETLRRLAEDLMQKPARLWDEP